MNAPQYVHHYVPSDYALLNVLLHPKQQYGHSPVCTPLCTFILYALLNVLLTHHSNMDAHQYVHPYVPSDYALLNGLLTHHSNMDAPQYEHRYVPSDCMLY